MHARAREHTGAREIRNSGHQQDLCTSTGSNTILAAFAAKPYSTPIHPTKRVLHVLHSFMPYIEYRPVHSIGDDGEIGSCSMLPSGAVVVSVTPLVSRSYLTHGVAVFMAAP